MKDGFSHQDWEPVVIHRSNNTAAAKADTARAQTAAATAKASVSSVTNRPCWKIEQAADDGERLPRVSAEDAKAIIAGRTSAKLTRAQLAQRANLKEKDVADIENRVALENRAMLAKIKRILGVKP